MKQEMELELGERDDEKWVYDSSVDYKGRVPLRASTGVWKASVFLLAIEFSERMTYFGIATSLIIYLTMVIHQDLKTAVKSINYWIGVTTLVPLFGGFVADAYLGRYSTVLASAIIYLSGQTILTMSWFVPSLRACNEYPCNQPRKAHEVIFFLGLYLISIGTGGHKPSLQSFGADQFDDDHPSERMKKMSFFNWWTFSLSSGTIFGVTGIIYIQEHVNWGVADIILTVVMAISLTIFIAGRRFYRYLAPKGSPFTPMMQVLVAAFAKRKLCCPSDPAQLYEVQQSDRTHRRLLCHTNKFGFLNKAAILEVDEGIPMERRLNPWRLATVTKVEEVKLIINIVPIWLVLLPFGISLAQGYTFFIKQGTTMNCKVGSHFTIPPASLFGLSAISMMISVTLYEKLLVPLSSKMTGNERGITILQRIGIGMVFMIITMVVAALVERKRLEVVKNDLKEVSSMSVFWLVPQFIIIGFGDGFTLVGMQEYFYDQVPDSMRSLGIALYLSVIGVANFLSSALITVIDHATRKNSHSWFGKDMNSSRLDKFYWFVTAMALVNLCCFVFIARRYSYKNVQSFDTTKRIEQQTEGFDACNA